jgi:hypothetical protein
MRNLGASLGLAVLGTLLVSQIRTNAEDKLTALGCTKDVADGVANGLSSAIASGDTAAGGAPGQALCEGITNDKIFEQIPAIYAGASETIFYVMAGVMVAAYVVAHFVLPSGKAPEIPVLVEGEEPAPAGTPTAPPA